jgi:hypothetical protein
VLREIGRMQVHRNPLMAPDLSTASTMLPATPVISGEGHRADLARLPGIAATPLTLLAGATVTALDGRDQSQAAASLVALCGCMQHPPGRTTQRAIGREHNVALADASLLERQGHCGRYRVRVVLDGQTSGPQAAGEHQCSGSCSRSSSESAVAREARCTGATTSAAVKAACGSIVTNSSGITISFDPHSLLFQAFRVCCHHAAVGVPVGPHRSLKSVGECADQGSCSLPIRLPAALDRCQFWTWGSTGLWSGHQSWWTDDPWSSDRA